MPYGVAYGIPFGVQCDMPYGIPYDRPYDRPYGRPCGIPYGVPYGSLVAYHILYNMVVYDMMPHIVYRMATWCTLQGIICYATFGSCLDHDQIVFWQHVDHVCSMVGPCWNNARGIFGRV